jgi:single-stranded DNA-binding protein
METTLITGRITKNAELKDGEKSQFITFSVAVYKGEDKPAKFFNCIQFFKNPPKNVHLYTKGSVVSCEGVVDINTYTGKDGVAISNLQLTVLSSSVEFHKKEGENEE